MTVHLKSCRAVTVRDSRDNGFKRNSHTHPPSCGPTETCERINDALPVLASWVGEEIEAGTSCRVLPEEREVSPTKSPAASSGPGFASCLL